MLRLAGTKRRRRPSAHSSGQEKLSWGSLERWHISWRGDAINDATVEGRGTAKLNANAGRQSMSAPETGDSLEGSGRWNPNPRLTTVSALLWALQPDHAAGGFLTAIRMS